MVRRTTADRFALEAFGNNIKTNLLGSTRIQECLYIMYMLPLFTAASEIAVTRVACLPAMSLSSSGVSSDPGELQQEVLELTHTNKRLTGENHDLTSHLTTAEETNATLRDQCRALQHALEG
ncbi:hypothetical protein E2C01_089856 [Portunus trituberculatus]|uniref:Uncharacterized protein n=1 Tax=Portunus trituberculatus TaxID=210409 RepID=A0A5B7JNK6_PORTR|nr:hypothetical protein [Portunus trituberculatus]